MKSGWVFAGIAAAALALSSEAVKAGDRFITVATTTSVENSGLLDHLLPIFEAETGIHVRVVAQGTGRALRTASLGDADAVMVHHPKSEDEFVAAGHGVEKIRIMYNRFVVVGPADDPAGIAGADNGTTAMERIAALGIDEKRTRFVSRGDKSGTHKKEREIWALTSINPDRHSGNWYLEAGAGMGAVLNITAELEAYTLSDRGTWLSFQRKRGLAPLFDRDDSFFNQYSVILVNPDLHPHIKKADALALIDWLVSARGQTAINEFKLKGEQAFFANANPGS